MWKGRWNRLIRNSLKKTVKKSLKKNNSPWILLNEAGFNQMESITPKASRKLDAKEMITSWNSELSAILKLPE